MSIFTRKGRHQITPADHQPTPSDRASLATNVSLFVTPDDPHVGPVAPQRRAWRAVPTAPYQEVHAPRTPQMEPAPVPVPVPSPRPYTPEPAPQRRSRYAAPARTAMPAGPVDVPGWLYPGYDGTAQEYARVMRLCDRLTGTTSSYSDPKAWPQHELTAAQVSGEAT